MSVVAHRQPKAASSMAGIPQDKLVEMIGKPIHMAKAPAGCVWTLERIEGDTNHLITPKTKRRSTGRAQDACYVRRYEPEATP